MLVILADNSLKNNVTRHIFHNKAGEFWCYGLRNLSFYLPLKARFVERHKLNVN